jgi:hypothetical protein
VFAAPPSAAFQRRVRPLISRADPVRHQVPRLVHAAHLRLVPRASVLCLAGHKSSRSSKLDRGVELTKVSNRAVRVATRAPDAATQEHVTAPFDTGRHAVRAFRDEEAAGGSVRRGEHLGALMPPPSRDVAHQRPED